MLIFAKERKTKLMPATILNKIEYLVLLVAAFAAQSKISEVEAYRYLSRYGAIALCEKHYGIMHTLSLEENLQTLQEYCQRKAAEDESRASSLALPSDSRSDEVKGGTL